MSQCTAKVIFICSLVALVVSQRQPTNITRAEGETNVFIPCPFEFRAAPSIWRIGGVDYTAATIPSFYYSITPGGIFINTVHVCMNQTSFQCIDTSDNALEEQLSDVGILNVTSMDNCTDEEFDMVFGEETPQLEVNHRLTQYGNISTILAWKVVPLVIEGDCNITRIQSFRSCDQDNVILNDTTENKMIILSAASLRIQQSGELVDFSLSSLSSQPLEECPSIMDKLRFNVTETETVKLLLGNNNCTCVNIERRGGLGFALSNPDPDDVDIRCPINAAQGYYSPVNCNRFNDSDLTPFFDLRDNPSENSHTMCFGNISKKINGLRLEFFVLRLERCSSTPPYAAREYFRSFEFNVTLASASILVNATSREVCFTSLDDCSLTNSTLYNVSIVDISGNALFEKDDILESTCQVVSQLELLPQCGPFQISTQPINEYIIYNTYVQQITSDSQPSGLCSCLTTSIQLEVAAVYNPQTYEIEVNYQCWTMYATPVTITFSAGGSGSSPMQSTCSNSTVELVIDSNLCDYELRVCGDFTFSNGSVLTDCALNCSDPILITCPTTPTMGPPSPPNPGPDPLPIGAIIGIVLGVAVCVIIGVLVLVIMLCCIVPRFGKYNVQVKAQLAPAAAGPANNDGPADNINDGGPVDDPADNDGEDGVGHTCCT